MACGMRHAACGLLRSRECAVERAQSHPLYQHMQAFVEAWACVKGWMAAAQAERGRDGCAATAAAFVRLVTAAHAEAVGILQADGPGHIQRACARGVLWALKPLVVPLRLPCGRVGGMPRRAAVCLGDAHRSRGAAASCTARVCLDLTTLAHPRNARAQLKLNCKQTRRGKPGAGDRTSHTRNVQACAGCHYVADRDCSSAGLIGDAAHLKAVVEPEAAARSPLLNRDLPMPSAAPRGKGTGRRGAAQASEGGSGSEREDGGSEGSEEDWGGGSESDSDGGGGGGGGGAAGMSHPEEGPRGLPAPLPLARLGRAGGGPLGRREGGGGSGGRMPLGRREGVEARQAAPASHAAGGPAPGPGPAGGPATWAMGDGSWPLAGHANQGNSCYVGAYAVAASPAYREAARGGGVVQEPGPEQDDDDGLSRRLQVIHTFVQLVCGRVVRSQRVYLPRALRARARARGPGHARDANDTPLPHIRAVQAIGDFMPAVWGQTSHGYAFGYKEQSDPQVSDAIGSTPWNTRAHACTPARTLRARIVAGAAPVHHGRDESCLWGRL